MLGSLVCRYGLCLGWVALLASCLGGGLMNARTGNAEKIMSETEKTSGISLTGKAVVEKDKLVVDYTVKNTLSHSIYVFDKMVAYDAQGQPKIDPFTAYCFWEEPSTLRLVRAVLTIPPNMNVYSLEIPYARELKPQASLTGRIELPVPVVEKSPFYQPPADENSKIVKCNKIRLYIGWTEDREGTTILEQTLGSEKGLRIRGSFRPHLVRADLDASVDTVAHTDDFNRSLPQNSEK